MYYDQLNGRNIQRLFECFMRQPGVTEDDVHFVSGLIKQDEQRDENLHYMEDEVYLRLRERGLKEAFERACKESGVTWTHHLHLD